jgi:hypothetical protein
VDSNGHALGGNGRTMILQRVYKYNEQGGQAYKELLAKKAQQFGLNPDEVGRMKAPSTPSIRSVGTMRSFSRAKKSLTSSTCDKCSAPR